MQVVLVATGNCRHAGVSRIGILDGDKLYRSVDKRKKPMRDFFYLFEERGNIKII